MTLDETTRYLHERIPLTRHLGAAVLARDDRSIRIAAPLAPNVNHRSTVFGGSLSALAILAGWAVVHLALRDRHVDAHVVVKRSEMDFDAPVEGSLVVTSTLPPEAEWERFLSTFARRGLARVHVRGTVDTGDVRAGAHQAAYAAIRPGRTARRRA